MNKFQTKGRVRSVEGTIIAPHNAGLRLVLNIANLAGKMESPLYALVEKRWPTVKREVRGWFVTQPGFYKLGKIHSVATQSDVWVVSMLCQDENLETKLDAVKTSLKEITKLAKYEKASLHVSDTLVSAIPELTSLIEELVANEGINVFYYKETK